jgi:hypothetical protein
MKECGRCGDDYEGYMYIVKDNFPDIVRDQKITNEYGDVCEECRGEITTDELYGEWDDPTEKAQ